MEVYVEHFAGGGLGRFIGVSTGSSTVTSTDSYLRLNVAANLTAAFAYYPVKIDKSRHQVFWLSFRTSSLNLNHGVILWNDPLPPVVDTFANFDNKCVMRGVFNTAGGFIVAKFDTAGTRTEWATSTHTWGAAGSEIVNQMEADHYMQLMIEIDPNPSATTGPRVRWLVWGRTATSAFSEVQGLELQGFTDWVDFSALRTNNDLWLVLGWPYNDLSITGEWNVERFKHAIGTKDYAWTNIRDTGGTWRIRGHYSPDRKRYIQINRSHIAIGVGTAGQWDDVFVKDPWVVKDTATGLYWMYYIGDGGSGFEIGCASSLDPEASNWTKAAGNPIVARVGGGDRDQWSRPIVWKDMFETDSAKRWKMLATGFSATDSKWRMYYYYSANPDSGWTINSTTPVLGPGGVGDFDERGVIPGAIIRDDANSRYVLFYTGNAVTSPSGGVAWSVGVAFTTDYDLTTLAKDTANNPYIPRAADAVQVITSQSGRTSNMASTTGFVPDQVVVIDQDATATNFITSRVRKVTTDTSVELYDKPKGVTGNTAIMKGHDAARSIDLRGIRFEPELGVWQFFVTVFGVFNNVEDTFNSNAETTGLLYSNGLLDKPKIWDWADNPPMTLGYAAIDVDQSNENIALVTYPMAPETAEPDFRQNKLRPAIFSPGLAR